MNIRSLGFLDTAAFQAVFYVKHRPLMTRSGDPRFHDVDELVLTDETTRDWKAAKGLLSRIKTGSAQFLGQTAEIERAVVLAVRPGGRIDWHVDDNEAIYRLHLCLIPSPGAWVYAGGESAILPVGQMVYVNHRVLNSEVNLGDYTTYKLVVDVRRPDADA